MIDSEQCVFSFLFIKKVYKLNELNFLQVNKRYCFTIQGKSHLVETNGYCLLLRAESMEIYNSFFRDDFIVKFKPFTFTYINFVDNDFLKTNERIENVFDENFIMNKLKEWNVEIEEIEL